MGGRKREGAKSCRARKGKGCSVFQWGRKKETGRKYNRLSWEEKKKLCIGSKRRERKRGNPREEKGHLQCRGGGEEKKFFSFSCWPGKVKKAKREGKREYQHTLLGGGGLRSLPAFFRKKKKKKKRGRFETFGEKKGERLIVVGKRGIRRERGNDPITKKEHVSSTPVLQREKRTNR